MCINHNKMSLMEQSFKVSRILHAGYIFEFESDLIAFDPIFETPFSVNCHAFPNIKFDAQQIKNLELSAVFISHYHEDHCSLESLNLLNKDIPIYIFCRHSELIQMISELGFKNVYSLDLNREIQIGAFKVIPRRALDEEVDSLFQIQVGRWQILNVVDSWIDPDTLDLLATQGKWDLILWPFQTMRELEVISPSRFAASDRKLPHEWLEQIRILNPRAIIPSSCQFQMEEWSWYNKAFFPISYQIFESEMSKILPLAACLRLDPGSSIDINHENDCRRSKSLSWVIPIGNQDVDYQYDDKLLPPSQAQVATYFRELSVLEKERVLKFCTSEIIDLWNQQEISEEDYFQDQKLWKLKLYPKEGTSIDFIYKFNQGKVSLAPYEEGKLSWLTEISMTKLFSALELGESLTSIYIRINEQLFSEDVERSLKEVDMLEDPLLRCVYKGQIFSYQKFQLKKLKEVM